VILLLAIALAGDEDALDEATRAFYLRAVGAEEARHYDEAAGLYRLVLGSDPSFLPASLGLGRALSRTDRAAAEALYRAMGDEPDAVEALADLIADRDPEGAIALYRRLETLRLGDYTPFRAQARILLANTSADGLSAEQLDAAFAAFDMYRTLLQGGRPDGALVVDLGAALLAGGRAEEAEEVWKGHAEAWPDDPVVPDLRARLDALDIERAASALALGGSEPVPTRLLGAYRDAQAAVAAGRLDEAEAAAQALVAEAPRTAATHALLADVLAGRKAWGDAEIHAVLARALEPDDASNRVRLGLLLAEAYAGRRDRQAVEELREAAVMRPSDIEVLLALGRLELRVEAWDRAIAAFEAALAAGASGAAAQEASLRLEALRREPPPAPVVQLAAASPLPEGAERSLRRATVLLTRGRANEAMVELEGALALAPDSTRLLNMRARLAAQLESPAAARTWLEKSLRVDPDQPSVLLELGNMALGRGEVEVASTLYEQAAEHGSADAHFELARLAEARGDWARVRVELAAYEAGAPGRASMNAAAAAELRSRANTRMLTTRLVLAFVAVVALVVPLAGWVRWRRTKTLRDLLDGAPECWHDAALLLSALRHEVLKHNTTVLPDVADALERGDDGPWRAFSLRAPDLLGHFRSYLGQLEALGRKYGMRLGLRRRDPILGPMHRAMARLASVRRPRPDELRALSAVVNGHGYAAIGRIMREICVLPVNADRVRAVYARVREEPGFRGGALPSLDVVEHEASLAVRMFRADLEDILANLLRNALSAGANRLAVELSAFDDPITGHAWVEIAVVDDAPGTLTNAMIRGRYIGRGLGIAVDLINRHGGSIRVDPRAEAQKAVVVQLPSVEAAPVEVEWTVA
jgi:predicted Zn-dependent protease